MCLRTACLVLFLVGSALCVVDKALVGGLLKVHFTSTAGLLLEDIPAGTHRDAAASYYLSKTASYWTTIAKSQTRLMEYNMVFARESGGSLTIQPEDLWHFVLGTASRRMVDGKDYVAVDVTFDGYVVGNLASFNESQPELGAVGGKWTDQFYLPIDPTILRQRVGYSCMDESGFPVYSITDDNAWTFYNDKCEAADPIEFGCAIHRGLIDSSTGEPPDSCHISGGSKYDCKDAVHQFIGGIAVNVTWHRVPYNATIASQWRSPRALHSDAPDGEPVDTLSDGEWWIRWRYFNVSSCEASEPCVHKPGWRRLWEFSSSEINYGRASFTAVNTDDPVWAENYVITWHPCHCHYHYGHFLKYGVIGEPLGLKQGFCMQTTWRWINDEEVSTNAGFPNCSVQGISPGWGDSYYAGISCQWIDITGLPSGTYRMNESFNFDNFICEGDTVYNVTSGELVFVDSGQTALGEDGFVHEVNRPDCENTTAEAIANNYESHTVKLYPGASVTQPCVYDEVGPARNCGFKIVDHSVECLPGQLTTVYLTNPPGAAPQAIRLCPSSRALGGTAIDCDWQLKYASGILLPGETTPFVIVCPSYRDPMDLEEPGGSFSVLAGGLWGGRAVAAVTASLSAPAVSASVGVTPPITAPVSAPSSGDLKFTEQQYNAVAIGVSVGLGVPLVALVIALLVFRSKSGAAAAAAPAPAEVSQGYSEGI